MTCAVADRPALGAHLSPARGCDGAPIIAATLTDSAFLAQWQIFARSVVARRLGRFYYNDVDDVLQQALLRLLRYRTHIESCQYRAGAVARIVKHAVIRHIIRESCKKRQFDSDVCVLWDPPRNGKDREWREVLDRLLCELTASQQRILRLEVDGLTGLEIAQELGVSHQAIYMARQRSMSKLRERYGSLDNVLMHNRSPTPTSESCLMATKKKSIVKKIAKKKTVAVKKPAQKKAKKRA